MLAIIDARSCSKAITKLSNYVSDILLFETKNITYNSVSGHPDIFIYQDIENNVVAPNAPTLLFDFLEQNQINFTLGNSIIGNSVLNSTAYNCVATNKYFFHKLNNTDLIIKQLNQSKICINLPQPYTACSLLALSDTIYITSDFGIEKKLIANNLQTIYFSPQQIKIVAHKNGFFAGCCGFIQNKLFVNGNIDLHQDANNIRKVCEQNNIEIICLHNNYLYDGGKILFF